jgi:DNA polymerase-3 subunit alpha
MPKYTDNPEETYNLMKRQAVKFLKVHDKFDADYKERLKYEFDVITYHGFQDYFMVVQDYVNWAKSQDIAVGPGRGSAGNSLTNYALGITLVDPMVFHNDFSRFLRKDKKKVPDIDCDFGQDRRDEVINYILTKYKGKSSQTLTYGKYNVKNLVNDLVKVCGCTDKEEIEGIKRFLSKYCNDNENTIDMEGLKSDRLYNKYNALYDNIIVLFIKLYGKVRYFGTHASSVILCSDDIESSAGLCRIGGNIRTSFDRIIDSSAS